MTAVGGEILYREMLPQDIEHVITVQNMCYPTFLHEEKDAFLNRLNSCPLGCFVATCDDLIVGYIQSHPWGGTAIPCVTKVQMNTSSAPERFDYFFLFDCAVRPSHRGRNIAQELVARVELSAYHQGYSEIRLVAVLGAESFWSKLSYDHLAIIPPGSGYGHDIAHLMIKESSPK